MQTIVRFARTLGVKTIVPGHGSLISGAVLGRYLAYLNGLIDSVRAATRAGKTLEVTLAQTPLPGQFAPSADSPFAPLLPFLTGVHRWNVQVTYQELNRR